MTTLQKRALEIAFDRGARVREVLELARGSNIKLTVLKTAANMTLRATRRPNRAATSAH
jgi:hypothetical protein